MLSIASTGLAIDKRAAAASVAPPRAPIRQRPPPEIRLCARLAFSVLRYNGDSSAGLTATFRDAREVDEPRRKGAPRTARCHHFVLVGKINVHVVIAIGSGRDAPGLP